MAIAIVFSLCLLAFTLIGVLAATRARPTPDDYLLAGRGVGPFLTALSSVATNNSGYMFIGLIGYAYTSGLAAVWLHAAWVLGDLAAWLWVHQRVREKTDEAGALSVSSWLGSQRGGGRMHSVTIVSALLSFVLLGGYAAAQLKAGSTTLEVLFGWHPAVGAVLGAVIVVAYSFSGGFRASVWTDAAQSFVMLGAMVALTVAAYLQLDGFDGLWENLRQQDPDLVRVVPSGGAASLGLFLLGFVFGGLGAVGQPHILTRTMALDDPRSIPQARIYYFLWFLPFSLLALAVGLSSRALLPDLLTTTSAGGALLTAEHALPVLSVTLLPKALVGLMLAGIFAATMSTADSQLLVCSAAVTQDVFPRWSRSYWAGKVATLSVALVALGVALTAKKGVFALVLGAWSILGATLGPLVLLRCLGHQPGSKLSLLMMLSGLATVIAWRFTPWSGAVYEILPGMLVPLAMYALAVSGKSARTGRIPALSDQG